MAKTTKAPEFKPVTITADPGTPDQRIVPPGHVMMEHHDGTWYTISEKDLDRLNKHKQELADIKKSHEDNIVLNKNNEEEIKDILSSPSKITAFDLYDYTDEEKKQYLEKALANAIRLQQFYKDAIDKLLAHCEDCEIELPE